MILTIAHNYMVDAYKCHGSGTAEDRLRGKSRLLTASDACSQGVLYLSRVRHQSQMFTLVGHILDIRLMSYVACWGVKCQCESAVFNHHT